MDKDGFEQIYGLFYRRIYRFIYYLVEDKELAADLTQNTFLKAWVAISGFDPRKGTLQAYLFTIARNLVIDYQRRKKELSLEEIEDPPSPEDQDEEAIRSEVKREVKIMLSTLDFEEKQLIIWRYFEDLDFTEIAQILNQHEGTIRVRVHRILKKLKERLEKNEH